MLDVAVRNARTSTRPQRRQDVGISGGRIVVMGPRVGEAAHEIDAEGGLLVPGLVDTHLHLDKSRLSEGRPSAAASLEDAIAEISAVKRTLTEEDVYRRAERTLKECIAQGTTAVRTQVEVDTAIGLRGLAAIRRLAQTYSTAIDLEICVFAQEGLTTSEEGDRLLCQALEEGADLVGGAPYADPDPIGQVARVFEIASQFDVDIDFHLDLADGPEGMLLEEVCRRTVEAGLEGRVTVGHVTQLSFVEPEEHDDLCDLVAASGVAVTVLPATDLYLMGRAATASKPRGVLPLSPLQDRGVACSIATNNVLNAFTPYGDCSLIRLANLYANLTYASGSELERCVELVTTGAARVMGIESYGIDVGAKADLVCFAATDLADVAARIVPPRWALKGGYKTFERPVAALFVPRPVAGLARNHA